MVRDAKPRQCGDLVNGATGATVALRVRSVITAETTRDGYLHKLDCLPTEDPTTP
jgi:hypothetical protein